MKILLFIGFLFFTANPTFSQTNTIRYLYDASGNRVNRSQATTTAAALWNFTGVTRCRTDSNKNNINTGWLERQEKDNNSASSTYNQIRWVNNGYNTTSCPLPPNWVATGNYRCQLNSNGSNSGYQEKEEKDNNPGSATYNQTRWLIDGYNLPACPLANCNSATCAGQGPQYKCVYGVCEEGYKIYTDSYYKLQTKEWICTYHYEWSDGVWSQDYVESNWTRCYVK